MYDSSSCDLPDFVLWHHLHSPSNTSTCPRHSVLVIFESLALTNFNRLISDWRYLIDRMKIFQLLLAEHKICFMHLYYSACRYCMLRRVRTRRRRIERSPQLAFCSIKVTTFCRFTIARRRTVSRAIRRCGTWYILRRRWNAAVSPPFICRLYWWHDVCKLLLVWRIRTKLVFVSNGHLSVRDGHQRAGIVGTVPRQSAVRLWMKKEWGQGCD